MLLLLLAAVPIMLMSSYIVWQSFQFAGQQARQTVLLARENAAARHEAALSGARQLAQLLVRTPEAIHGSDAECAALLSQVAAYSAAAYEGAVVVDSRGALRCAAGETEALTQSAPANRSIWFHEAQDAEANGEPVSVAQDNIVIVAAAIVDAAQHPKGALALLPRMSTILNSPAPHSVLGGETPETWLIGASGAIPGGGGPDTDFPASPHLDDLLDSPVATTLARSRGGDLFAYAAVRLPDSLILLAGFRAQDVIGPARNLLIFRLAVIFAVLLAGMGIMVLGANRAVAQPVKVLTQAVRRWRERDGEHFDPSRLGDPPAEIAELSRAFSDTSAELADRERELRGALAHQDTLMREIHHRVKNNLQIVASLLNLQASRIREPTARAEFQSARDRVRALATLHRHLYADSDLHSIRMRGFLTELCEPLFQAAGETPNERIGLYIEAPDVLMSGDQATPLALIVTESVSNALRHGFPDGRSGRISVCLTVVDQQATLSVAHEGISAPPASASEPRGGLGLQLMHGFARQLGGTLLIEDLGRGTRYSVSLALLPGQMAA